MGCKTCASTKTDGKPAGCRSGGCDRMTTMDWIQSLGIEELDPQNLVELSHKNGARKSFAKVKSGTVVSTGDMVVVDPGAGTNIAKISLSGPLVGLQLRKKNVDKTHITQTVIRKAGPSDIDRLGQARRLENTALVKAREIARTLGLEMKIGDVEYQGDLRKATFYYTADGRVDFRELVRHYAQEFRIKVEMRQIGARQESARIGGLGSCGRELCCSTWLTDFKTVSTAAARNQNIALNQSKLSGQCGRLKCCLNYELDMYVDALKRFPKKADTIKSKDTKAFLIKIDIFNNKMFYNVQQKSGRPIPIEISPSRVKEILEMNKKGEFPPFFVKPEEDKVTDEIDFEVMKDPEPSKKKKTNKRRNQRRWKKKKPAAKKTPNEKSSNPKTGNKNTGSKKPANKKPQAKNTQAKKPGNKKS